MDPSTISREIRRNPGWRGDRGQEAQRRCLARRAESPGSRIGVSDGQRVATLIRQEWSPAEIRDRFTREGQRPIRHEWIDQYLKRDRQAGGTLYRSLFCQRQRHQRKGLPEPRGHLKHRVSFEARLALVEGLSRIGPRHPAVLVSHVERRSGYTLLAALPRLPAPAFREATVTLLGPFRDRAHTLTLDHGTEGAEHERIAQSLDATVYFAHTDHSWERGTNENTHGLIRQYCPKCRDLGTVTRKERDHAIERLHHRPRKRLGFRTPNAVFFHTRTSFTVALPT